MRVTFTLSVDVDVDPEKMKTILNTEGLLATEATKVLKDKVWRTLDEEYSEYGRFGDYSREIRDDIKEVVEGLGVLRDNNADVNVSRPQVET